MAHRPLTVLFALVPGCFSPNLADGDFSCGPGSVCPQGFGCDTTTDTCKRELAGIDGGAFDTSTTDAAFVCPTSYSEPPEGGCYRFNPTPTSWTAAEADCESDGGGIHLVVVDSVEEHFVVHALTAGAGEAWVGYSDIAVEGDLQWVAAGEFRPENETCFFQSGGPNNSDSRDCVVQDENVCGDWFMRSCDSTRPYVCEFDGSPPTPP